MLHQVQGICHLLVTVVQGLYHELSDYVRGYIDELFLSFSLVIGPLWDIPRGNVTNAYPKRSHFIQLHHVNSPSLKVNDPLSAKPALNLILKQIDRGYFPT